MEYGFIIRRFLHLIPVTFGIIFIVFVIIHLTPGDPISIMIGTESDVTPEEIERLRAEYGFDKPIWVQFFYFLGRLAKGDFGKSIMYHRSATEVILEKLPATIELAFVAILFVLVIALPLGILSAIKNGTLVDKAILSASTFAFSMPNFWLGIVLILVFSVFFRFFPVCGRIDILLTPRRVTGFYLLDSLLTGNLDAFVSALRHIFLPALTLGIVMSAIIIRLLRNNMLTILSQDYIATARSKGLPERIVLFKHALKNALIPTINIVGLQLGELLTGSLFVETVFAWPGIGSLAYKAILNRDYAIVQGTVAIAALTYVLINLLVDMLIMIVDPRIRYKQVAG